MTKFEGKWRTTGRIGENNYDIEYEFVDANFTLTDNINGYKAHGTFTFDDEAITFDLFYLSEQWTQGYALTEAYVDIQAEETKHFCGRFFKQ